MAFEEELTACQFDVVDYSRGNSYISSTSVKREFSSKFFSFFLCNEPNSHFVCCKIFNLFVFTNIKREISIHQFQYCQWANFCAIWILDVHCRFKTTAKKYGCKWIEERKNAINSFKQWISCASSHLFV